MLKMLLLSAAVSFGAANMLKKLVFALALAFVASSTARKLMVATAVAIGATQADTGLSAPQWYEGTFTCKIARSQDVLEVHVTTQQGELGGWGRLSKWSAKPRVDNFQPRGDTVSFQIDSNPRAHVELHRNKITSGLNRGGYSDILAGKLVMNAKRYDISCTRS
jgi:hypothetical protein